MLVDDSRAGGKQMRLYCYRGGGTLDTDACAAAGGIGCLCKEWDLAAALRCALKLAMCCCPFGPVTNGDARLCYTVEHREGRGGLLDDDDVGDPDTDPPSGASKVEAFRSLCRQYFQQMLAAASITAYEGETDTISEAWAFSSCTNAVVLDDLVDHLSRRAVLDQRVDG